MCTQESWLNMIFRSLFVYLLQYYIEDVVHGYIAQHAMPFLNICH